MAVSVNLHASERPDWNEQSVDDLLGGLNDVLITITLNHRIHLDAPSVVFDGLHIHGKLS